MLIFDRAGPSFDGLFFWPKGTDLTWYQFFTQFFFESDGLVSVTALCTVLFVVYRLSGSPLDVSAQEKQCEREELWAAHNDRFRPRHHKRWLEDGPAGKGNMSWCVQS